MNKFREKENQDILFYLTFLISQLMNRHMKPRGKIKIEWIYYSNSFIV